MNYIKGNLFDFVNSGIIVHSCNAQKVMGSGFAKDFKQKYPKAFDQYRVDLDEGYTLGNVSWYIEYNNIMLASLIGQEFYGRDSNLMYTSYDAINNGLNEVFAVAKSNNTIVSMPKIGSGLGNASWEVISEIITNCANKINFPQFMINVYEL